MTILFPVDADVKVEVVRTVRYVYFENAACQLAIAALGERIGTLEPHAVFYSPGACVRSPGKRAGSDRFGATPRRYAI
jgi:hypothetical protein